MTTRIKLRRDTAANWLAANPILAAGEPGLETDTGKVKYGDGETAYALLPHAGGDTLTDDGSVVVTAGSTAHWIATQRRESYDTEPRGLRYDSQGNLYALTHGREAQDSITVITKYTAAGAVAWQKTFTQVYPNSLAIDSTDRAYITVSDGDPEITVIKFSTAGDILWKKSYDIGPLPVYDAFIEEKSATTLALVAQAANGGSEPQSVLVLEISSTDGSVLLKKTLELESLQLTVVAGIDVDSDENVFVTGYYYDVEANLDKMFIEKLDENLNRVWSKTLEAPDDYNMSGGDCASDAQGNIYAVGSYEVKTVNAEDGTVTKSAAILTKLNSSGVVQWTRRVGPGPCGGFIVGLTATDVGDVYLSSTTYENKTDGFFEEAPEFIQEAFRTSKQIVARYNTQGAVIWQRYVDVVNLKEEPSDFSRGQAVAVFGNKFAVDGYGLSTNNAGGAESSETGDDERDYFVVQLPTDGTELTIGNLSFTESRVPGRFVTHEAVNSSLIVANYSETILAEDSEITADAEARIANAIVKSETYSYTFGADGTLTIPNDGDIKLTQSQVGYLMAVDVDTNDDITGRATCVDSQGYLYFGGQDDDGTNEPFVMKISPTGDRIWGVIISEDGGNSGRVNALSMNPTTGNLMVLAEMTNGNDYSILVTMDQDTGRILSHQKFSDTGSDVFLVDMAWTSTGTYVLGGWKDGDFSAELPVTPQTGSTTGVIRVLRSALPADPSTSWQIGGTDITPFENIAYVERYTGLTGTTRTGSGAVFTIDKNQGSAGTTFTPSSYGDNLALAVVKDGAGFKYISAQRVNWAVPADYDTLEALPSGTVFTVVLAGGTYTFTTTSKGGTSGSDVVWYGDFSPEISGTVNEAPSSITFGNTVGSYSVLVTNGGTNYLPGHKIKILGTDLGGATPDNDCIITVQGLTSGAISSVSNTGTPAAVGGGSTTYTSQSTYNASGTYGAMGTSFSNLAPNVWNVQTFGWFDQANYNAVTAFTSGTSFTMDFLGITYTGTLTSDFIAPEGSTTSKDATVSWTGDAPTVDDYDSPNSFTIGGVTYVNRFQENVTYDFMGIGASASTTQILVRGGNSGGGDPIWPNNAEFNSVVAATTGAEITVVYQGTTYTGTLSSGFTQPDPQNDPNLYSASITWPNSSGLPSFPSSVDSITIPAGGGSTQFTGLSGTNHQVGSGFTMTLQGPFVENDYNNYFSRSITANGSNYVNGDVIVIPGTSLGGASTANDLTISLYVDESSFLINSMSGTAQSTTWKLETTTQVDFSGTGSWSLTYPTLQEGLLVTPTWQRTFNTSATVDDYIDAVAVDSNDNIIAVGKGYGELDTDNFRDLALVFKFNSSGALQWVRQLNEVGDHCYGQSVITIGTDIYVTHDSNDDGDTVITKLDTTGTVKWQRRTGGGDDSCIARTANGNLIVVAEEYYNPIQEDAIKIFQLTASGETVYKRWLLAHTDDDTYLASTRGLCADNHSFYIGAYYDNNNADDSGLAVRLPIDGSGTGDYGSFRYVDVNPETNNFAGNSLSNDNYSIVTINIEAENNYAGALAVAPTVSTGTAVTTGTGTFYVDSWYPDLDIEPVHDTDGGSIVFADGSTQSTSATDIPQRRYNGQRYTLSLKDRGHHILCDISDENIIIPYYSRVPFPVGSVITIVNTSDSSIGINVEGQSTSVMLAGEGFNSFYLIQAYGVVTLLNIGPDRWVISGNVNPD